MILKRGDKGDNVKELQKAIMPYYPGLVADGDFGPNTEAAVKKFQTAKGLVADGIVGPKTIAELFGKPSQANEINIKKMPIQVHVSKKPGRKIEYIVLHYTAGGTSRRDSAKQTRNVFINRQASADFVVDDYDIVQVSPSIENYYCWHCGDNGGHPRIKNSNSIGIEICSTLKSGWSGKYPNHDGWYYTDAVLDRTVELVQYLMKKYNIPVQNVVRHFDVTKKLCPGIRGFNTGNLYSNDGKVIGKNTEEKWIALKNRLK